MRAGANALDDLLADVTALGEIERVLLFGFLRKVALAQIHAVTRHAARNAIPLQRLAADGSRAVRREAVPHCGSLLGGKPDFIAIEVGMGAARDGDSDVLPDQIDDLARRELRGIDAGVVSGSQPLAVRRAPRPTACR